MSLLGLPQFQFLLEFPPPPTLSDHPSNWPLPKRLWKVCTARLGWNGIGTGSPGNGWVLINRAFACPSNWATINLGCQFDVNLISYSCRFTTNLSLCWALYELVGKVLAAEKVSSITHYEDIHFSSLQHRWERKIPNTSIKLRLQLARVLVV